MSLPESPSPTEALTCHDCGATISSLDPLGGGLCESCLWRDLAAPVGTESSPVRHLVPGHEILEEIGRGGMGVVYRASQLNPARDVALKMLLPGDHGQSELKARFQQEARTLAELDHPAILPLFEVGEIEDRPYFTMKLALGGTLASRLKPDFPWPAKRAAELTASLADALHYAHVRGVIHRDIKPGNVLFDEGGRAYLADFGLAKLDGGQASFSRSAGVLGTPAYLAPEIAASGARAATTSSDLYSLGAVLYQLLTGRPPFATEGLAALLVKIAEESPPTPSSLNAHVPRDLEIICLKCLRKAPSERYASASDFADDLRRWQRGEPVRARPFTPLERLAKWARRRPALAGLSAALAATAIASAAWLTHSNRQLQQALQRAEAAQARADQRAEFLLGDVADKLEALGRLDLLDSAYQNALETEAGLDDSSRRRRARLLARWGRSRFIQMQHEAATAPLTEAMQLARSLPATAENIPVRAEVATEYATLISETGAFEQAVGVLDDVSTSIESARTLPEAERHEWLARLAECYVSIGLSTVESSPALQEQAARAVAHRQKALELDPENNRARLALASSLRVQGETTVRAARSASREESLSLWKMADDSFQQAQVIAAKPASQSPRLPAWTRELALIAGWFADTRAALAGPGSGVPAEAAASDPLVLTLHKEQVDRLQEVVNDDPRNIQHLRELSSALEDLADYHLAQGDLVHENLARSRQGELIDRLHAMAPAARSWLFVAMNADLQLGRWQLRQKRPPEADRHLRRAWESAVHVLARRPLHRADFEGIQKVSSNIVSDLNQAGRPEAARPFLLAALAHTEHVAGAENNPDTLHWLAAHLHRRLAELAENQKNLPLALSHNISALELRSEALRRRASQALADPAAVTNGFLKSETIQLQLGQPAEAVKLARQALEVRRAVPDLALDPNRWAKPIVLAVAEGVKSGGRDADEARLLAAEALAVLYPDAVPNARAVLASFTPSPDFLPTYREAESELVRSLQSIAGSEKVASP